ncbi:MAG: glutamate dehydrogenase, partial [Acidimicrobiaceae bacterium]|nr:glutamate dehydrogenase [Acidimicrobiaceae bacterium]
AAAHWKLDLKTMRVAIQGFGNVGSWVAHALAERGVPVVAVSDVSGAVHREGGLDVGAVLDWVKGRRPLQDLAEVDQITNEQLLELDCDVLIPAALGEVITEDNAAKVRASVLVEAANNPTTPAADRILTDRGIRVIPDLLANAGGVTGSYFEWAQNIQQFRWKEERFNTELAESMLRAFNATVTFAETRGVDLRRAAFAIAIDRVARASKLRGYV